MARKQGFDFRIAQTMILGAWARGVLTNDTTQQRAALDRIDKALDLHTGMGAAMDLPYYLTLKADLLGHMGRLDEALAILDEALALMPADRQFFYDAEMRRVYAKLLLRKDPRSTRRVEQLLEESLTLARSQGARMLELRTCLSRCQLVDGQDSTARQALESLMADLEEGHQTPDWKAASIYLT